MVPDLIKLLLDDMPQEDGPLIDTNERAILIDAEAEREGLMLRNAPRRYATGNRHRQHQTKYDRIHFEYSDSKRQLKKLQSDVVEVKLPVPKPILPAPSLVQERVVRESAPKVVRSPMKQFERMRARRLAQE